MKKIFPTKDHHVEKSILIKVTPFDKSKSKTLPHKHDDYYEILYLSQGSGFHSIDTENYPIVPPAMYFVRKEHVHYWEIDSDPEGFVIILRKDFFTKSLDGELRMLFMKIFSHTCLFLKDSTTIDALISLLAEEYKNEDESSFHVSEGLLKSLFTKVLAVSDTFSSSTEFKPGIYQSFIELLSSAAEIKNSVNFYSRKLNTTPQNLNAVCRKEVNQSAADVISEFLINEAKRLLLYSNQTVSEISYSLKFNDSSHFIKYFRRHTGKTPHSFRIKAG